MAARRIGSPDLQGRLRAWRVTFNASSAEAQIVRQASGRHTTYSASRRRRKMSDEKKIIDLTARRAAKKPKRHINCLTIYLDAKEEQSPPRSEAAPVAEPSSVRMVGGI